MARPRRRSRFPRPVRLAGPLLASVFTVLAWAAVAHNSGSGWVQALGALMAATLFVGLVLPGLIVRQATVAVLEAPGDATVLLPVEVRCRASSRVRVTPVDPAGPESLIGPSRSRPRAGAGGPPPVDDPGTVTLVPTGRGVYGTLDVDVASGAPFGLVWWSKRVTLALPHELLIGPRPGHARPIPPQREDTEGTAATRVPAVIGEPRGVRAYRSGDHRRWVHWRATAHTGRLMVREMENPTAEPVTVLVRLPDDPAEAETVAGNALATAGALLGRGERVVLGTVEEGGPRLAQVADWREASRRLARAVPSGAGPGVATDDIVVARERSR